MAMKCCRKEISIRGPMIQHGKADAGCLQAETLKRRRELGRTTSFWRTRSSDGSYAQESIMNKNEGKLQRSGFGTGQ